MLSLNEIERMNIFKFLDAHRPKIMEVFKREGTAATRRFICRYYRIRMRGNEIREFLKISADKKADLAQQAHRQAWSSAGWCGDYAPLGYVPGDDKRLALLAAGLVNKDQKTLVIKPGLGRGGIVL